MFVLVSSIVVAAMLIIRRCVEWRTRTRNAFGQPPEEAIRGMEEVCDPSIITEQDLQMAHETHQYFLGKFGKPTTEAILRMNAEERKQASDEVIGDLCALYNIRLQEVRYFSSDSGFCGNYVMWNSSIQLNIAYLMSEDAECILNYLDTIVHELRHAIQFQTIKQETDFWQIPEERQNAWLMNALNYIQADENLRYYVYQPIERDAATFAALSLKGLM